MDSLIISLDPDYPGGVITMQEAMRRAHVSLGLRPHLAFCRLGRKRWDPRLRIEERDGQTQLSTGYLPSLEYLNYAWPALRLASELRRYPVIQVVSGFHSASLIPITALRPFVSWVATPFLDEIVSRRAGLRPTASIRFNYALRRINLSVERWTYNRPRQVLALSDYTARRLREESGAPLERMSVLRCPIDMDAFRPDGPRWAERPGRYVVAVGRADDPRKNMASAVRVFTATAGEFPDVHLVIVGKVDRADNEVAALVRASGLGDRVHFPGMKGPAELASIYRGADAFLMTSRQEGLGIVVMEAQASGIPVVIMRCGGSDELIDEGDARDGWLLDQGDEAACVAALRQVLRDPDLRANVGATARRKAQRQYGFDLFTERLRLVYREAFPEVGQFFVAAA